VPNALAQEKLTWEKELLGLYISGHPLDRYRGAIESVGTNIKMARELTDGKEIKLAGIIEDIRPITTKKGEPMLFIKIADFTGSIEAVVFPRVLTEFRTAFTPDACIAIKAKVSERNGEKSLLIDRAKKLT
jgi:DNA polymerase-3 subunit alpha